MHVGFGFNLGGHRAAPSSYEACEDKVPYLPKLREDNTVIMEHEHGWS